MDHRLSVSERGADMFFCEWLNHTLRSLFSLLTDWYDGGNGPKPLQPGQPHERVFITEYLIVPLEGARS